MLHRFLQVDNYIQDLTNTQNYNQYGYVLNNPLLYTDPTGNQFNDGKDCVNCGPTEGQQIGAGGIIGTIVNNWDDWGVKDWANKNINGDKISKWWKSKISTKNLFGHNKNSGPPPNMSKYVNLGNSQTNGNLATAGGLLGGASGVMNELSIVKFHNAAPAPARILSCGGMLMEVLIINFLMFKK